MGSAVYRKDSLGNWKRIRNLRHYTGSAWVRDRAVRYADVVSLQFDGILSEFLFELDDGNDGCLDTVTDLVGACYSYYDGLEIQPGAGVWGDDYLPSFQTGYFHAYETISGVKSITGWFYCDKELCFTSVASWDPGVYTVYFPCDIRFYYHVSSATYRVYYSDGSIDLDKTQFDILDEQWHHIVVQIEGSSLVFYFDNGYTVSGSTSVTSYSFLAVGGTNVTQGKVGADNIRLYNRALTSTERDELYKENGGFVTTTTWKRVNL